MQTDRCVPNTSNDRKAPPPILGVEAPLLLLDQNEHCALSLPWPSHPEVLVARLQAHRAYIAYPRRRSKLCVGLPAHSPHSRSRRRELIYERLDLASCSHIKDDEGDPHPASFQESSSLPANLRIGLFLAPHLSPCSLPFSTTLFLQTCSPAHSSPSLSPPWPSPLLCSPVAASLAATTDPRATLTSSRPAPAVPAPPTSSGPTGAPSYAASPSSLHPIRHS